MRGRKPKSTDERALSGNAGKRAETKTPRAVDLAPKVSRDDPPPGLSEFAQKKWREFLPLLQAMGQIRDTDREALRTLCIQCDLQEQARALIEKDGLIENIVSKHGSRMKAHPGVAIMNAAARQIANLLGMLGMTSQSRVRMLATGVQLGLPFGDSAPAAASTPSEGAADDPTGYLNRTEH